MSRQDGNGNAYDVSFESSSTTSTCTVLSYSKCHHHLFDSFTYFVWWRRRLYNSHRPTDVRRVNVKRTTETNETRLKNLCLREPSPDARIALAFNSISYCPNGIHVTRSLRRLGRHYVFFLSFSRVIASELK